jgi:hypothetical protein
MNQGRDPARTLARRVRAQAGRTPPPPPVRDAAPPSPPRPEADYDPLDALVARSAAGLKQSVVLEQAIQSAATAEPDQGNAALEATAREALALQSATASPRPALIALRHGLFARVDTFEIVEAAHGAHPVAAEPRRTRAP